jgi:type IV secretory pathway VirB9-like protein
MEECNVKSTWKMAIAATLVAAMVVVTIIGSQQRVKAAQNEDGSSVHVDRTPAPEVGAAPDATYGEALETPNQRRRRLAAEAATGVPSPEQYPFTQAVEALKAAPDASGQPAAAPVPPHSSAKKSKPPKETRPKSVVAPSPTGKDAVAVSDRWQSTRDTPAEGKDGRVIYSEGAGMPTVVCAPLRLCVVELQAGERLTGDPQIGDSVRWNIQPASYGTGELTTFMIVIKPKAVGLDTNLVITTDRRTYYLRLMSSPEDYVARVSFEYPDDSQALGPRRVRNRHRMTGMLNLRKGSRHWRIPSKASMWITVLRGMRASARSGFSTMGSTPIFK